MLAVPPPVTEVYNVPRWTQSLNPVEKNVGPAYPSATSPSTRRSEKLSFITKTMLGLVSSNCFVATARESEAPSVSSYFPA